jgi:hypothetical protein
LKRFLFSLLIIVVTFSGCGTAIKLHEYLPSALQKAPFAPSKEVIKNDKLPRVIIMDVDENGIDVAKNAHLGSSIAGHINTLLARSKSVNVVSRQKSKSLQTMIDKEVKAAELAKEIGTDVGQADFIITGLLSSASYTYDFSEGYYYEVKNKEGKTVKLYRSPKMSYRACSVGSIKVLTLPKLHEVESIAFNECSYETNDVRSPRNARKRNDSLVRQSGTKAAKHVSYALKNVFAKKGYVYELRKKDDDAIIHTTLGYNFGAFEGARVNIYTIESTYNALTEATTKEIVPIGQGIISNQITPNTSWIIVDELSEGRTIQAGDFVKITYTNSAFSGFSDTLHNVVSNLY